MKGKTIYGASENKQENISYWFVGINISSSGRKLETSLIGFADSRKYSPIFLGKSVAFDLPSEITSVYEELRAGLSLECFSDPKETQNIGSEFKTSRTISKKTSSSSGIGKGSSRVSLLMKLTDLRIMLASVLEEAVTELLNDLRYLVEKKDIVAVVTSAPLLCVHSIQWEGQEAFYSVIDSSSLAQKIGINVIDSLMLRDADFSRHSTFLLPFEILLGSSDRNKLVIDLGEQARWYFLPTLKKDRGAWKRLQYNEVAPCGSLLRLLTKQATKGEVECDFGGKLSVQGRCVSELLDYLRHDVSIGKKNDSADALFLSGADNTVKEKLYVDSLLNFTPKASSLDALCTSVHWISDMVIENVSRYRETLGNEQFDIILMGGAKQNGLLFSKLISGFPSHSIHSVKEYGNFHEDSLDSVAVGVLGALFVMDIPMVWSNKGITNNGRLGRLTVGSLDSMDFLQKFKSDC